MSDAFSMVSPQELQCARGVVLKQAAMREGNTQEYRATVCRLSPARLEQDVSDASSGESATNVSANRDARDCKRNEQVQDQS